MGSAASQGVTPFQREIFYDEGVKRRFARPKVMIACASTVPMAFDFIISDPETDFQIKVNLL